MATKKCPYCAEEIQEEAIFCRFCRQRLDTPVTVKEPEMKKCPFCAEMIPADSEICSYCGEKASDSKGSAPSGHTEAATIKNTVQAVQPSAPSIQAVQPKTTEKAAEGGARPSELLFDIQGFRDDALGSQRATLDRLCAYFDSVKTEEYYDYFTKRARNDQCCAVPGINDELLRKLSGKARAAIAADEKIVFFRDKGIIIHGREGMLLTDKRIIFINKELINSVSYADIKSLSTGKAVSFLTNQWIINGEERLGLDTIGCNDTQLGMTIAFICEMARRANSGNSGYRIKIEIMPSL